MTKCYVKLSKSQTSSFFRDVPHIICGRWLIYWLLMGKRVRVEDVKLKGRQWEDQLYCSSSGRLLFLLLVKSVWFNVSDVETLSCLLIKGRVQEVKYGAFEPGVVDFGGSGEVKQRIVGKWETLQKMVWKKKSSGFNGLDCWGNFAVRFDPMSGLYLPDYDCVWLVWSSFEDKIDFSLINVNVSWLSLKYIQ